MQRMSEERDLDLVTGFREFCTLVLPNTIILCEPIAVAFSSHHENDPRIVEQRICNWGLLRQSGQTVRHSAEGSVQNGDVLLVVLGRVLGRGVRPVVVVVHVAIVSEAA